MAKRKKKTAPKKKAVARVKREQRPKFIEMSVEQAVGDAFANAEGLKDELQEWYDNLPESFQNGSKGETLQEAIGNFEGDSQPDVPERIADNQISVSNARRKSRADRLQECKDMLEAAAQRATEEADYLDELTYDPETGAAIEVPDTDPQTEDERDHLKNELETFVGDCETAISNWDAVEFPGMYG